MVNWYAKPKFTLKYDDIAEKKLFLLIIMT